MEDVRLEIEKPIATVTIDRPPLNALRSRTMFELYETFATLANDAEVRCVILTGSGEKAFAAGADIREFLPLDGHTGSHYTARNTHIRESIRNFPNPIICAVNGLALGGGAVLALVCDIRVACEEAKFSLAEINLGIIGGTQHIAPFVPPGVARRLVYTGDMIAAKEAQTAGMVDMIVPRNELMNTCRKMAQRIVSQPPLAIRLAKQALNFAYSGNLAQGLELEKEILQKLWATEDKNEAVNAFLEKRPGQFKGK
jgi:enoyl-CoA hydratase